MISRFILGRVAQGLVVLIFVSVISFAIINAAPGDPALALFGGQAQRLTSAERIRINNTFGVDKSITERYLKWAGQMLKGDLGVSYREGRKVIDILRERLPHTLILFSSSMILIIVFSILLGIKGGLHEASFWDKGLSVASIIFSSIPAFWLGILGILVFSVYFHILPSSGTESLREGGDFADRLKHLILPTIVMASAHIGLYARFIQEKIKEENKLYYVQVARANGMEERYLVKGILKNAIVPYINYLGITIPGFLEGQSLLNPCFLGLG